MKTILQICIILFALSTKAQTIYTVTKTTDPDPFVYPYDYEDSLCAPEMYGTLQWAIRKANDTQDSVKIVFNINQSEPDIILNFTLPVITNKVFIDGTTQQGYISGHPKIKIVGGGGIKVQANGCKFKGLYIEQNNYIGIQCYYADYTEITECVINKINTANAITYIGEGAVSIYNSNHCKITENYIGTNADSCTCYYPDMLTSSCRNGINIVSYPLSLKTRPSNYNVIKNNTIANCSEKAIWIQQNCKYNSISENKIYQCANAIVLSGNGNENKQPPVITSFENDTLYGTSVPNDIIEVFGSTGDENANEYLGTTQADGSGNWNLFAQTTYQYVVTTATDENSNTSNFSLKFEVKTCMYSVCFEAPGHPYCSDANPDPSWCKEKTICLGEPVTIYFCEMCGGINEWHVDINGEHGISGTYDFTQVTNYGQYEVWQTTFTPTIAGNYNLVLYVYNEISNTNNPYYLSLIVLPPPTPTITQSPNLCQGNTSVLNAGIGYSSYLWNTGATTQTITISQPGTYFVTVTDAHGCTGIGTINVIQYDSPTLTITGNTNICSGGTSILTAQTNATSYLWSNNSTSQSITVNQGGTYSVTVTSSQGCTNTASVTVTQSPTINVNASFTPVSCYHGNNGTATVNATGGIPPFQYIWSNGQTTQTIFNLTAGTYAVTVTDANGCTATTQVVITQPSAIQYTASITSVSCFAGNDGSISLTVSGGTPFFENFPYYLYQWNTGATSSFLTNLISGTYYCTITDANNCTTVATVFVPQPQKITATFSTNPPTCYGYNNGSITINVNGGTPQYSYNWNTGATGNPINHLIAGNYTVTVTDANHCTAVFNTSLNQPPLLTLNVSSYTPSLCGNETNGSITVVANGGNIPYTYNIGNGAQTSNVFQGLTAGTYTVTVTDANGCTATQTVNIISLPLPLADYSINETCLFLNNPISFTNTSHNATTYLWNFGDGSTSTQVNPVHTFNDFGTYCVSLTAYNECGSSTTSQTIYIEPSQCVCNTVYDYQNISIPPYTSLTINGNKTVKGDIVVETGATLTIKSNSTLRFAPDGRIIVKRYGKLILENNVTLTSLGDVNCDFMWKGVEVWGSPVATSSNVIQGVITMNSNSKIKNAHIAVLLGARNDNVCGRHMLNNWTWAFNNAYAGGVIKMRGDNIQFDKNGIDIKFLPKISPINDGTSNIINNCSFKCTNPLLDVHYNSSNINHYPNIHNPWAGYANPNQRSDIGIQITNIKGLVIKNNIIFNNHEYGIFSTDAQQTTVAGCTFTNLRQGMHIDNSTQTLQSGFDISGCSFDNIPGNTQGTLGTDDGTAIYINSGRGYKIHDGNQFKNTYSTNMNTYKPFGIITSFASGIEITNNIFSQLYKGIIINNSGTYGSSIKAAANSSNSSLNWKGNIFFNCSTGIFTQNNNSNLCIRCNEHNSNNIINSIAWYTISGTLANQGFTGWQSNNNYTKYGAGNKFTPSATATKNYLTSISAYNYIYHIAPPEYVPYVFPPITKTPMTNVYFLGNTTSCPFPDNIPIPDPNIIITSTRIDSLNNAISVLQQQYQTLIANADKGHTQDLLNAIQATPPSGQLKNMLITDSPLSDTVLITLNVQNPLSPGNYKNVMEQNLPVSRKVAPSFYNRIETLPNGIKNQLKALQANNPGKTTIGSVELQLDQAKQIKVLYFNEVISMLLDTLNNRKADAMTLFEQEGTPDANLILASTYMSDSNYTAAAAKIAQLPDEYADWKDYASMLLLHFEQGKTLEELDSNQIDYIRALAYQCPEDMATANAKAVLFYLFRETVPPCPVNETKVQKLNDKTDIKQSFLGDNYPDPFSNRTVIPYCLPEGVQGELTVKDVTGRVMLTIPLNGSENKLEIETKNWAAGVYVYSLTINGEAIENRKMVKNE